MFIVCKPHTASLQDHASVVSALVHTGRRLDFKVRCRLFDFVLNYALSYAQIYEFLMMWTRHRFVGIRYDFQHSCNEWRCAHGFPIIMIRICNAMTLEDIGLTSVIRKDNNTIRDHKKLCACFFHGQVMIQQQTCVVQECWDCCNFCICYKTAPQHNWLVACINSHIILYRFD